jgi:flagellin-like hook-associated protein FlgL
MDITPYIGTIVTVVIAVGSVYAAIASRLTRLETKIETLTQTTEKHNNVIERTYKLETEVSNIYHRIDEMKENLL